MQSDHTWEKAILDYKFGCINRVEGTPKYFVNGIHFDKLTKFTTPTEFTDFIKKYLEYYGCAKIDKVRKKRKRRKRD